MPDKTLTPNQLRREAERLKNILLKMSREPAQGVLIADDIQVLLARVVEQVPLVLDELEWELSSLRAAQKAREAEADKNKQLLYVLLTIALLGLFSAIAATLHITGLSLLETWGINKWIGLVVLILLVIGMIKTYKVAKYKKVK